MSSEPDAPRPPQSGRGSTGGARSGSGRSGAGRGAGQGAPRSTAARTASPRTGPRAVEAVPAPADGAVPVAPEVAPAPGPAVEAMVAEVEATAAPAPTAEPAVAEPTPAASDPAASAIPAGRTRTASADAPVALAVTGLTKHYGTTPAVADLDLSVRTGTFFGLVGPNGAGKTTTLSIVTGLLRPDSGTVRVHGIDVWSDPNAAKRQMGVLPDRLRLFDRLTGAQLLHYNGMLRGLDRATVRSRTSDLAEAFGLQDAMNRLVADYSAGMTKKIALAASMIHSPRLLVLDEPFESVDPVSAANVTAILQRYVDAGGTVVLSSHSMDLIQRICDDVAIVVAGRILAAGAVDDVRAGQSLEDRFVELAGGRRAAEGMEWLHSFSD